MFRCNECGRVFVSPREYENNYERFQRCRFCISEDIVEIDEDGNEIDDEDE